MLLVVEYSIFSIPDTLDKQKVFLMNSLELLQVFYFQENNLNSIFRYKCESVDSSTSVRFVARVKRG